MLTIRNVQLDAFADLALYSHIEGHLAKLFPAVWADLGPVAASEFVRQSVERARRVSFDDPEALGFASLEIAFGPGFIEEPQNRWARAIVEDPRWTTSAMRMDQLRDAGLRRLSRAAEDEQRFARASDREQ